MNKKKYVLWTGLMRKQRSTQISDVWRGMVCRLPSTLQFWAVWRVNISIAPLERTVE